MVVRRRSWSLRVPVVDSVLVNGEYVEELVLLPPALLWQVPLDPVRYRKELAEPLVLEPAQAIESHLGVPLAKQHGFNGDGPSAIALDGVLAVVVDQIGGGEDVQGRHLIHAGGVVVVAVDGEGREADVEVRVLVIRRPELCREDPFLLGVEHLEGHLLRLVQAVLSEDLDALADGALARLVLVKDVAPEQDEIALLLDRDLEDLLESVEGVVLPHEVLLLVSQVVVGCDQDAQIVGPDVEGDLPVLGLALLALGLLCLAPPRGGGHLLLGASLALLGGRGLGARGAPRASHHHGEVRFRAFSK